MRLHAVAQDWFATGFARFFGRASLQRHHGVRIDGPE
jgi:hypothetical protein